MKVGELAAVEVARRLSGPGLRIAIAPYVVRLRSPSPILAREFARLYADYELACEDTFVDFHVRVAPPRSLRRWIRPLIEFEFDGERPFNSLTPEQAFAFFEWGLNWCIHGHLHDHLVIHAGVVEREDGLAVVMPGQPGAGKSTLCAALAKRGWRLLSDELAMFTPASGRLTPVVRPISLKNESIDVMRGFAPDSVISEPIATRVKGRVAHMRPPRESVARGRDNARPGWLIFPKFSKESDTVLESVPRGRAFLRAAEESFNYSVLGATGFETMRRFIAGVDCFDFRYSDLDEAIETFAALAPPTPEPSA